MKKKISHQFMANTLLMFVISCMIALFTFILIDFADDVISKNLKKNHYTAESLMKPDYHLIDAAPVIQNGGGMQVVNSQYEVVRSEGLDTIDKKQLTIEEFTEFLIQSKSKGIPYNYSIKYNAEQQFWLIVTFPTSIRIDFAIAHNTQYPSSDMQDVRGVLVAIVLFYVLLLLLSTFIYSRITSWSIVNPLKKLIHSLKRIKEGDYAARVNLNLTNEFGELEEIFNGMAEQIEHEISLRKQSEESRKQLVLDISHDLKTPLASIIGYAELCRSQKNLALDELNQYTGIILENGTRANRMITELFELSKLDSPEFILNKKPVDVCEWMRELAAKAIPVLDRAAFSYDFDIPDKEIEVLMDTNQMDRVFQNLLDNAVRYNAAGTHLTLSLSEQGKDLMIILSDNGSGMPSEMAEDIFKPFVRADHARNSERGGTGLGLAIAQKIMAAHGGSINLKTEVNLGCEFTLHLPKI